MGDKEFMEKCKYAVVCFHNDNVDILKGDNDFITKDDVYVVWLVKALQNNKALLSTNLKDGMYYECTYNGDKKEIYVDAYKKWKNFVVKIEEE